MRFTLRQLEVFLAVAHSSNLTRAAGQLNMSQSAASSSLKDLENQFDVLLFDRVGKRLQLSEQGRLLRPKAEALMAVAEDLEQSMLRHATAGPLNVRQWPFHRGARASLPAPGDGIRLQSGRYPGGSSAPSR